MDTPDYRPATDQNTRAATAPKRLSPGRALESASNPFGMIPVRGAVDTQPHLVRSGCPVPLRANARLGTLIVGPSAPRQV